MNVFFVFENCENSKKFFLKTARTKIPPLKLTRVLIVLYEADKLSLQ